MTPTTSKPTIGYVRVSTEGQAIDGVSLEAQRAKLTAYCDLHGLTLGRTFADEGASGKRADNRPGLQAALESVCKVKGVLVVYSLSRLGRSTRDLIDIADRLQRCGADFASLTEQIDTTTAAGKMVFRMLAVLAEFERDLVSERTTAALAHKRANGQKTGGHVPYGYDLAGDGATLLTSDAEQAVIRSIVEWHRAGVPYRRIADRLNRAGKPTKNGGQWSAKVVRAIRLRERPRAEATTPR